MKYQVQPLFEVLAEHGEGPIWDPVEQKVYWVDIIQGKYYKGDPKTSAVETYEVGQPLGVLALRKQGGLVMAVRDGMGFYDEGTQEFKLIEPSPEQDNDKVRFNDGAVDPGGRFWAGTMGWDPSEPIGKLFCLDTDHAWHLIQEDLYITNGMGWSKDLKTYFLLDTPAHVMYAYDYDVETGFLSNRRIYKQFEDNEFPDGMCLDSEDGFWVAMWEGKKIVHLDPEGKLIEEIPVPAIHPTSCCFGGPDLKTLYISTSNLELSEAQRQEYPQAGRLLQIETDTVGKIEPRFAG